MANINGLLNRVYITSEPLGSNDRFSFMKEMVMGRIKFGANFTIFLLFFGVAALEAFQTHNWLKAGFWLAIGIAFLVADNLRRNHSVGRAS